MREENTNFLTTRQLARMWQVSEATVKRWADAGRLHPSRTLGGHRRFALSEVLRFQNEQGLDVSREARRGLHASSVQAKGARGDEQEGAAQFFEAIVRGHEGASSGVLLSSYVDGLPLVNILDVTVTQAMRRLGNLWHCGEVTVADEHLATQTATRAVETLRECIRIEMVDDRRAVVCTVEEEMHELAVLCAQLLLEEKGLSVVNLGAHTPFYAMTDAIEKHRPHLICISSTANMALSRNAREYDQFRAAAIKRGVLTVLGGEGFRDEAIRQRFPADLHADNFRDLLEFIQSDRKES
ncbi:MAG TPA: helix-turn-helix domain-containing protein [Pyrinomonadaceae bacterium]|jgi:excisionase family DNA binding protein